MRRITFAVSFLLFVIVMSQVMCSISILEKDGRTYTGPTPPPPYAKYLADNGFCLGFPGANMRETSKLTLEQMKQFNVVVIPSLMGWTTDMKPTELTRLLDTYLKNGGGVLVFQDCFLEGLPLYEAMNDWLKQYGGALRWEEIVDEAHEYKNPPQVPWQRPSFFWTDNITASPITREVKTLFYVPGGFRGPYMAGLNVDKNWQVLVNTAATTKSYKLTANKADFVFERLKDTPREGSVPLLAVRKVGKGRLAVFSGSPAAYWFDLKKPVFDGVPQEQGDGQRASDWMPLLFNLLNWLGERGHKTGKPGGYIGNVQFQVQPDWGNRIPIDWERVDQEGVSPELVQQTVAWHSSMTPKDWKDWEEGKYHAFKILVAARTQLSGGKGSVADWKAAALAAGYSAVVFRENILQLTEAQWKQFTDECTAASDVNFRAIPGQEFDDWIGNRFMRFTGDLKYPPHKERLTDGKMRDQLSFFCDVGWPVNLPLSVKNNPTEFWNYRLSYGWPLYVYQKGQLIEDNRRTWEELVDSYEYPTPLALHLLDDPAQIAQITTQGNTYVLGTSLPDFNGNSAGGLFGCSNNPRVFTSTGPMIDRFHALNMFRTTLGSRGVPGSYRYRVFIKAHSEKPLARVELWGGDEPLRTYRPMTREFRAVVDELHDRQRGLWLKVVDSDGGEARATGIMVHDKMLEFVWCGDFENALPYGLGTDKKGNVAMFGVGTRVKSSFQGIDGPAVGGYDMWRFVPWGTDTSAPAVGLLGDVRLFTDDGKQLPDESEWYTSRVTMPYANRDILFERLTATRSVRWQDYVPKHMPTINGWYPYTNNHEIAAFDLIHEDAELHRNAEDPALQWNIGTITFKQDVTLSNKETLNIKLAHFNTNVPTYRACTVSGEVPKGDYVLKLGKGGYLTWGGQMGNITVFALDDDLSVRVNYDGQRVYPTLGYSFPGRQFKKGEKFTYESLIMRWPTGIPFSDRLDLRVASALNLSGSQPSYTVKAQRGKVIGTQFFLDLQAEKGSFAGTISHAFLGIRIPVRLYGLNPRWTASIWRKDTKGQILVPTTTRGEDGPAYFSLDLEKEGGDIFIGHPVTCDQPALWLRVLQRSDGGFDLVVHNPKETTITTTLKGEEGGPVTGWSQTVQLTAGEEQRLKIR